MAERIKTIVIVTILAVVVWLFAEAESLGDDEARARIEFPQPPASAVLVRSEPRNPTITIGLRGGKAALQRAASALEAPIRLEPGRDGVPESDGRHTVDLLETLRQNPALTETRVTIEYVRPPTLDVVIESLVTVSLPIHVELPDVQTEAPPTTTPSAAEVRMPTSLADTIDDSTISRARLTPEQTEAARGPGTHSFTAPVQLPSRLQGQAGVSLLTERAHIDFTVVSTLVTEQLPSVPVQVLLAPTEANEWLVDVEDEDQILSVELTGPRGIMSELKSALVSSSIVAVLSLSDIELQSGVTAKPIAFWILRDGVLQPLPREVTVRSDRAEVRFSAERVSVQ